MKVPQNVHNNIVRGIFLSVHFLKWLGAGSVPKIELRDWVLPYWYQRQNDPYSPAYTIGGNDFRNLSFRNWTTIRLKSVKRTLNIDRFGVVYFPEIRVSLEFWVYSDQQLYTPTNFDGIIQQMSKEGTIRTVCSYDHCRHFVTVLSYHENFEHISCKIGLFGPREDTLKYRALYCVIRPYDYNGLSAIYHLEYRDNFLWVNHRRLLFFEKEPKHCYFTNGIYGDVTKYLQAGSGNTEILTPEGMGTGLVGFSGLQAELSEINLFFPINQRSLGRRKYSVQTLITPDISDSLNQISSDTALDQLLSENLRYLKGLNCSFNIYQILALNRFSDGSQSRLYLKECMKKVAWDGSLQARSLSQEQLIWGVGDYYRLMMDSAFIEKYWTLLKRMGYAIWHQKVKPLLWTHKQQDAIFDQQGIYEKLFWLSGALSSLEKMAFLLGDIQEGLVYKEQNRVLTVRLTRLLSNCERSTQKRVIPLNCQGGYGAGIIGNLAPSYPLQIWKSGNSSILETIHFIFEHYFYQGGIYSPFDFPGIDLVQSARFGQVLIREGYDYTEVLKLLIAAAGGTGSLPERIHPRSLSGIGEDGHHPDVIYHLLLLIRNIFVLEENQVLELLPGILTSKFWKDSPLRLKGVNTFFGEINCDCLRIGDLIQIDFWPKFRTQPEKIRIRLSSEFHPVFVDAPARFDQSVLEIDPGFHRLRLKKRISVGLS
jgi:hypothetical protein